MKYGERWFTHKKSRNEALTKTEVGGLYLLRELNEFLGNNDVFGLPETVGCFVKVPREIIAPVQEYLAVVNLYFSSNDQIFVPEKGLVYRISEELGTQKLFSLAILET